MGETNGSFEREGIMRGHSSKSGKYSDVIVKGILADERFALGVARRREQEE